MLTLPLIEATNTLNNNHEVKAISVMFGSANSDQEVVTFFQALEAHETLTSLNLDNTTGFIGLKVLLFAGLAKVLTKNTTLTELSLIGPDSCRDDRTTEFDGEAQSANEFVEALAPNTSLISFKLENVMLGKQATDKLLTALITHPTLQTISFIHRSYELGFDMDQMNLMADILRGNNTLTTLTLACNGFEGADISIFFEALPFNAKLATLNFGCGQISATGGWRIANFIEQQSPDSKLTSLTLSFPNWCFNEIPAAFIMLALKENRALTTFCLSIHNQYDLLPPLLCQVLRNNETLHTLKLKNLGDLSQGFIETKTSVLSTIALGFELNTTLTSLELWDGALENEAGNDPGKTEQIEKINGCLRRNRQPWIDENWSLYAAQHSLVYGSNLEPDMIIEICPRAFPGNLYANTIPKELLETREKGQEQTRLWRLTVSDSHPETQASTEPQQAPLLLQHGAFGHSSQPVQVPRQTRTLEVGNVALAEQRMLPDSAALEKKPSVGRRFSC